MHSGVFSAAASREYYGEMSSPPKEGPLSCSQSMLVQPERRGEERRARGLWTVYMVKLERDHNKNLFGVFQENEKPTAGTVDFGKRRLLQVG